MLPILWVLCPVACIALIARVTALYYPLVLSTAAVAGHSTSARLLTLHSSDSFGYWKGGAAPLQCVRSPHADLIDQNPPRTESASTARRFTKSKNALG